ncbi:MAG: hypothetical protein LKE96_00515 [Acetobacter peroxydans]|jgi:hypothetical protein|nr:hypothetical protein [Acetobacter peroxydans]
MSLFSSGNSTMQTRSRHRLLPGVLSGTLVLALSGCTQQPQASRIVPQTFGPPAQAAQTMAPVSSSDTGKSAKQNDPAAPRDTPLCGTAAREAMAMAVQNYPQPLTSGNSCTQNTCYNTQTGTYIAADGTQRVCR